MEATKIVGAQAHDVQGEAARPGLIQHQEKVKGNVITVQPPNRRARRRQRQALLGVAQQKNQGQWDRVASQQGSRAPEQGPGEVGNLPPY